MLIPGLLSISFRKLSAFDIIEHASSNELKAIEWGSDIHLPVGDYDTAKAIDAEMKKKGLISACYGTYYRAGDPNQADFADIITTAKLINAPTIRVWAGSNPSRGTDKNYILSVKNDLKRICRMAEKYDLTITVEFHSNTLADDLNSLLELRDYINSPAFRSGWQPTVGASVTQRLKELITVLPFLGTIHVFHWNVYERLPLIEGSDEWLLYFQHVIQKSKNIPVMLEFIKDDSLEQLKNDSSCLHYLIEKVYQP